MPIRPGHVVSVVPHARFKERFEVRLLVPESRIPADLYTMNPLHASLCERAGAIHKAVTIHTKDSRYGEEIVEVTLADWTLNETEVAS